MGFFVRRAIRIAMAGVLATISAEVRATTAPSANSDVVRQFGYITTSDGTQIAYVVYRPATSGKYPTILEYGPYSGAGTLNARYPQGGMAPSVEWLRAGYAFIYVSVRGTGCSQGVLDPMGPHEGPDGAEVIEWIGKQPWSDQKVGMTGGSYPGHTQILVAAQHPKWLKAISPSAITMSGYDDNIVPGGIYNIGFPSRWSYMIQPAAEMYGAKNRISWGDTACVSNMATHPAPKPFETYREHPFYDDYWKARSLESYVDRVEVPTFISQSWQDHETSIAGATEAYKHIHAPKWLSLSNGGHDWTAMQDDDQNRIIRWMDYWLKGAQSGAEKEPRVTVYWDIGSGFPPVARWVTHYADWPVAGVTPKTFYLTNDGDMSEAMPITGVASKPQSYTYGIGAELIGDNAQFSLAPDPTGTLVWTSKPITKDLTILGSTQVYLFVSSENVDTDFVVALHDVYPNGDVEYLQRGVLRASMREIDESRSTPDHIYRPFAKAEPLVPGKVYQIRLSLPPLGTVLRPGHKLQVTLTSPSAIPQTERALQPLNLPGRNTVYSSSIYPTRVAIPVLPDAVAEGPVPACGSMPYMPCRPASKDGS